MNLARKAALTLVATVLGFGLASVPAPAHADSSWGCGGYCRIGR